MADYDHRPRGGRGGYNNRKRRYRDDDDHDPRPPRRRYEEPPASRLRKQLLAIAESPLKRAEDDVKSIVGLVCKEAGEKGDEEVRRMWIETTLGLVVEQPFKVGFVAGVVVGVDAWRGGAGEGGDEVGGKEEEGLGDVEGEGVGGKGKRKELVEQMLRTAVERLNIAVEKGEWREVKLYLKFLGQLQGLLEGEGVWVVLQDLLAKAVDLQTENNEEMIGPELVKIILFTIPYVIASSAPLAENQEKAASMIENTDLIASEPHALQSLVDPYPGNGKDEAETPNGVLSLLQKQLQNEAANGWELACLPRPWRGVVEPTADATAPKHALPAVVIPEVLNAGPRPLFPELYFSVYANQDVETVPPTTDVASCLLRDALVDTINILDYNRNATARFLIDVDCYFSPDTFVKRATPFDRLRDIEGGRSTWKPEDVAVDAVFSQLFQLPAPEHKLVYYHSVLTESCKIAPAAIAPSLGRAIRYLYRGVDSMDLELSYRFMDWFAHHLSNFGFTWKWTEWIDDVQLPSLDPKKAFIEGGLDKEIRLSFAQRIKGTLPAPYQRLISEEKEKDTPDFKFSDESNPYHPLATTLLTTLRKKLPEDQIAPLIESIHTLASSITPTLDPLLISTDIYVTSICHLGAKSLSHVLSCIERCKDRLLALGPASPAARLQIIESVMAYWRDQPGVGVNIVDKLLNYTVLSPGCVVEWALKLGDGAEDGVGNVNGKKLARAYVFEMISATVGKVTGRVRQLLKARNAPGLLDEQRALLDETLKREKVAMAELFRGMEGFLEGWVAANDDADGEKQMFKQWAERWLRVFKRKEVVEEAWLGEGERVAALEAEKAKVDGANGEKEGEGHGMVVDGE